MNPSRRGIAVLTAQYAAHPEKGFLWVFQERSDCPWGKVARRFYGAGIGRQFQELSRFSAETTAVSLRYNANAYVTSDYDKVEVLPECDHVANQRCRSNPRHPCARVATPAQNVDAEAYRLYLQGRDLQLGKTIQDWAGVRDLYRAAVQRDANFAKAWAQLANAEANVASNTVDNTADGVSQTHCSLLPSRPPIAQSHWIATTPNRSSFARWSTPGWAIGSSPPMPQQKPNAAALTMASFTRALGYMEKAEEARRQSTSLNPLSASDWSNYAYTCEYNEDTSGQLEAAQRAHELARTDVSATRGLARALIANHRGNEAVTLIKDAGWLKEPSMSIATRQLLWMAGHGDPVPTEEILAGLKAGKEYLDTAVGYLADAQRWDDAASVLDRWGASARSSLFTLMRRQWSPLRTKPQFWALMQREGLVKYWHDSGQWPDFCNNESVCLQYR
jgi:hypothetical protein